MIVIIEGPDGAGKSTLAHALAKQHGFMYRHEGPPPTGVDPLQHYLDTLHHLQGTHMVLDRFALGERVYGPVLRGKDGLGPAGWIIFREHLRVMRVQTIVCLPDYDTCLKSWASGRAELIHDLPIFYETYSRWEMISREPQHYAIDHIYDYTRDPIPELHP